MSVFTPNLLLQEPVPLSTATDNVWGASLNGGVYTLVDNALAGIEPISTTGGVTVLASNQGAPDQARNRLFRVSGALASNATLLMPSAVARYFAVTNGATGSSALIAGANNGSGAPAGKTVSIPPNATVELISDGTNVFTDGPSGAYLQQTVFLSGSSFLSVPEYPGAFYQEVDFTPVSATSKITIEATIGYQCVIANGNTPLETSTLSAAISCGGFFEPNINLQAFAGGAGAVSSGPVGLALSPQGVMSFAATVPARAVTQGYFVFFVYDEVTPAIFCAVTSASYLIQEWL